MRACWLAAALPAGCGGGGDAAADGSVPWSALESPAAFNRYLGSLGTDDLAEPIDIDGVTAPNPETDEPIDGV